MINDLRLLQFRCYESVNIQLPEEGALIVGANAQGKTSILEAVCMLVRLQSPRAKKLKNMLKFGEKSYGIAGNCWDVERKICFKSGLVEMYADGEEVQSRSEYFTNGGLVVWMGNDDLSLVRGAGEIRRRYLDFLGCQLDAEYRRALASYRKALKVRNLLLKDDRQRSKEIAAYDGILIKSGDYLVSVRQQIVHDLLPLVNQAQQFVGAGSESVSLEYSSNAIVGMQLVLEQAMEKDLKRGQTSVGPHRDDIKLSLNQLPAAEYGSEGQQKTLALALKLAQGDLLRQEKKNTPIYLLDDIFGELDYKRRNAVFEYLPSDAQMLITTTHVDWLDDKWKQLAQFQVEKGNISQ